MIRRSAALALLVLVATSGVASARRCPNIMLVVDKSGSMNQDPMGGGKPPSKWQLVVGNLTNALLNYGPRVPFGLTVFSSFGGGAACYNETALLKECKPNIQQELINELNKIVPNGNTNTAEAIRRAYTDSIALKDPVRENYLVLITDGTPNCGSPEPKNTIDEIKKAAAMNPPLKTYVVGFDGVQGQMGVDPGALNEMALAGGVAIPGCDKDPAKKRPCYFSATTPGQFQMAIDTIIGGLAGSSVIAACDDTCFSLGCPEGKVCVIPKVGADPTCLPDPCAAVTCDAGMYCSDGHCLKPCPECGKGQQCQMESCVERKCTEQQIDTCAATGMPGEYVCDETSGACAKNLCFSGTKSCPLPSFCNPLTGYCDDDKCRLINCPLGSTCYNGYCATDPPPEIVDLGRGPDLAFDNRLPDMAVEVGLEPKTDDGGCTVAPRSQRRPVGGVLLLAVAGLFLVARRRRAR